MEWAVVILEKWSITKISLSVVNFESVSYIQFNVNFRLIMNHPCHQYLHVFAVNKGVILFMLCAEDFYVMYAGGVFFFYGNNKIEDSF